MQIFVNTTEKKVNSMQFTYRNVTFDWMINYRVWYEPMKIFCYDGLMYKVQSCYILIYYFADRVSPVYTTELAW